MDQRPLADRPSANWDAFDARLTTHLAAAKGRTDPPVVHPAAEQSGFDTSAAPSEDPGTWPGDGEEWTSWVQRLRSGAGSPSLQEIADMIGRNWSEQPSRESVRQTLDGDGGVVQAGVLARTLALWHRYVTGEAHTAGLEWQFELAGQRLFVSSGQDAWYAAHYAPREFETWKDYLERLKEDAGGPPAKELVARIAREQRKLLLPQHVEAVLAAATADSAERHALYVARELVAVQAEHRGHLLSGRAWASVEKRIEQLVRSTST
ncbi:hypothetical protein [Kitasatospora purpeofusca]|uniref:hypothetical protein n=1 Tax=Kitasatospora purpeofusca TaxID=67352 RepID=UPI00365736F6